MKKKKNKLKTNYHLDETNKMWSSVVVFKEEEEEKRTCFVENQTNYIRFNLNFS